IYALAIDAAAPTDEPVVFLFDDVVVRINGDGRGTSTYRQVVHVREQRAVSAFAERRLGYSPDRQKLTLNWARVLSPSGEVISDAPAQMQESDVAAAVSNPVYVNRREIRLSMGGVAPNTIIDMSYTVEELDPYLEGDFYTRRNVHATVPVRRSRFILDVPAEVQPRITANNLNFEPVTSSDGSRRAYTWLATDVPRYRPEPFAPDTNSVHMHVIASLPLDWSDIGRWYGELSRDRDALPATVQAKVREITADAASRLDSIRAVHRWVAQDIRYVSVSLGVGGYQPRTPGETVTTGFGDCKDKATLFIATLRSLGIDAHPVLLNTNASTVRREHPSIRQFNHMIAAVAEADGYTFTDLTAALTPYGEVPLGEQGGFALVVRPDSRTEQVVLPAMPAYGRRIDYLIVATLAESGELSGSMEETSTGYGFEARRALFAAPLDSARTAEVMRALLRPMRGATGDSIQAFAGRDLYAPVRYRIHFSGGRGMDQAGGLALFSFPFGVLPATPRIRAIEAMEERRSSIVAEEVLRPLPPTTTVIDMRVTLPEGWRARVPDDVVVQ
ncbi:MAG: DUF3857 domain-containing transglutaminase family protein, partial [Longimicrobiales bacterium]